MKEYEKLCLGDEQLMAMIMNDQPEQSWCNKHNKARTPYRIRGEEGINIGCPECDGNHPNHAPDKIGGSETLEGSGNTNRKGSGSRKDIKLGAVNGILR